MANRGFWVASSIAIVFVVACKKSNEPAQGGSAGSGSAVVSASAVAAAPVVDAGALIDAASANPPFQVGEVAWALWKDGKAHRGKVLGINADGTYPIQWDSGEKDDRWPAEFLTREKPVEAGAADAGAADAGGWKVGDRVMGQWSDKKWYPGKIAAVNADGTYRVEFKDGDVAPTQPATLIRAPNAPSSGGGAAASGGKACNEGSEYTRCGGSCFNLKTNNSNCGACGNQCPKTARTCVSGKCTCMSGSYDSDGDCL